MLTSSNVIFYIAFLGQIFLVSYYFPGKILARIKFVRETYPPEQYPRLYPKKENQFVVDHATFATTATSRRHSRPSTE
jgi:hypothetical protein